MTTYCVVIPGPIRGKQRARSTRQGRMYTPAETVNAEAWVRSCVVQSVGQPMLEGPLAFEAMVSCAIPDSWSAKKRRAALLGEVRPTGKPDLDNIAKLLADSMNKLVWRDDAQIVRMTISKRYAEKPETVCWIKDAATLAGEQARGAGSDLQHAYDREIRSIGA